MEKLLARSAEMRVAQEEEEDEEDVCLEMERVAVKSRELRTLHERFWSLMMGRLERLQEGHDFFGSANEVDALPPQLPAI